MKENNKVKKNNKDKLIEKVVVKVIKEAIKEVISVIEQEQDLHLQEVVQLLKANVSNRCVKVANVVQVVIK